METKQLTGQEAATKLKKLVKQVDIAMMCTHTPDGKMESRPMSTAGVDDDGTLWFFTNESSGKVDQIESTKGLHLCYSDPSSNTYATVMGYASQVDDEMKKEELWNDILKVWFPKGKQDPDLTLIKMRPTQAEYWDDSSSKMVVLFKMAKAAISGESYDGGEDSHGTLKL